MGMLEWIYHIKTNPAHWGDSEKCLFTYTLRKGFMRRVPASLKGPVIAFLDMSHITLGNVVTHLGNLRTMGFVGSWSGRDRVEALNC